MLTDTSQEKKNGRSSYDIRNDPLPYSSLQLHLQVMKRLLLFRDPTNIYFLESLFMSVTQLRQPFSGYVGSLYSIFFLSLTTCTDFKNLLRLPIHEHRGYELHNRRAMKTITIKNFVMHTLPRMP
jgi:hypothetical protein